MISILWAALWFAVLGGVFGLLLAVAAKAFHVEIDPRVEEITGKLPGANCGGCGYTGCQALAEAIAKGEAKCTACVAGSEEIAKDIARIMGV